jgi:hypothetical protein
LQCEDAIEIGGGCIVQGDEVISTFETDFSVEEGVKVQMQRYCAVVEFFET